MNESTNPTPSWEAVQFAFMDAWEAAETKGAARPTLGDYLRQYPQYAADLPDFVLEYVALAKTATRVGYAAPLSPEAERAGSRVRETLGIGEYAAVPEAAPDFADLMADANISIVKLKNALGVPATLVHRMRSGLLSDWSGALVKHVGNALSRSADEVAAALQASLATGGSLAAAHFKATGGDPDEKAVVGTPKPLAETLDELGVSAEQKARWLADE